MRFCFAWPILALSLTASPARADFRLCNLTSDRVSVSLTIDNVERLDEIIGELRHFADVETERDSVIVCLVGDNIRYTPGVARRVFNALDGINIRMISQGASLLNLSFVVAEADLFRTVSALHQEFFTQLDATVFELDCHQL